MRIFLAGGAGAMGRRLVTQLIARGHRVAATTRVPSRMQALRDAGAEPVLMDALDPESVMKAVEAAQPEAIVHEMTAIAAMRNLRRFDEEFALTNRLRTEGTEHLLTAARAVGATRFIAQSYTGWPNTRSGGRVKTEDDPLDADPPPAMAQSLAAIRQLESLVTNAHDLTGIVLRYGSFYGPGTSLDSNGETGNLIRQRRFPLIGGGTGVWSFIHIDDAASATRIAIEQGPAGVYNIVDDEPAEVVEWLPDFAQTIGAKPPYRLPAWLGRWMIGDAGVSMMTEVRGASNAKAKRMLNWQPYYTSWRDGFRRGLTREGMRQARSHAGVGAGF